MSLALHTLERRITVEEYHAMGEAGVFPDGTRIELLDGRLIEMPPPGPAHSHCVNDLADLFNERLFAQEERPARTSVQNPIQLAEFDEPLPDLVLFDVDTPTDRHIRPDDTFLVVEVADTSLAKDRDVKAEKYGMEGIREYWVVDLENAVVEVFREPDVDGYGQRVRHRRGDELTVAALPDLAPIPVSDVLPADEPTGQSHPE
jgi:Uma2 family endonuclease